MLKPDQIMLPRAASAEQTVALALWKWDQHGMVVPTLRPGSETQTFQREGQAPALT